jgi:hypothetical protein
MTILFSLLDPFVHSYRVLKYYTYYSLVLFYASLLLPSSSWFKTVILINSVMVGIMGNYLYYTQFEVWKQESIDDGLTEQEAITYVKKSNVARHTLPALLSIVLLITGRRLHLEEIPRIYLMGCLLIMLWLFLPYQGLTGGNKVATSYHGLKLGILVPATAFSVLIALLVIWIQLLRDR